MREGRGQRSTEEWQAVASRSSDLLYEIITWPQKKGAWTEDDFYDMGKRDWTDFRERWQRYWPEIGGTCVELGCGVGRVTAALAADFDRVIGLDVAPDMLDRAAAAVPDNVELRRVDGERLPLDSGSADGVFSVHVLQHLDDLDRVAQAIGEVQRVLRPGGTAMLHVNLLGPSAESMSSLHRMRDRLARVRNLRAIRRGRPNAHVTMNYYQTHQVWPLFIHAGLTDIELQMFPVRTNGYPHSFWFARRPQDS